MACILKNSTKTSRKTRLIHRCNLTLSLFNDYRNYVSEAGLLEVSTREDGAETYKTTSRGRAFLEDYEKIRQISRRPDSEIS